MSDRAKPAIPSVLTKLAWPILALAFVLVFRGPLGDAITHAGNGGGAEVSIGILKISIPKSEIPIPPVDVERVMPRLDSGMRQFIASVVGGQNTPDNCYQDAGLREFQPGSATQNLVKEGLITFTPEQVSENGKPCLGGARLTFTPLYDAVRTYLLSVMLAVKFDKA